jgi:hypothetical protein
MRNILIFILLSVMVLMGCIIDPSEPGSSTEQGDLAVVSFEILNESSLFMGDSFNVSSEIISTSYNATYKVSIKLGDETIYTNEFQGNETFVTEVYAPINGKVNLTIQVHSKDLSKFIEKNLENNLISIPLHIHSYGQYDFSSKTSNHSIISNERIHSTKLYFENPVNINSIGTFVRVTAPLNIDSYLIYEIVNDNNGTPGNHSLFNVSVQIYKVSQNWEFLLLQNKIKKFESGTYWLNVYVSDKNFLNVACQNQINSTTTMIGRKFSDEINWKEDNCNLYYIISSAPLIETYEDFENRFSIFK